jgi:type VI protein secretion system component Hcp
VARGRQGNTKKLTVDKPIDAASPGLFQRVVTATHDPSMTLTIRRTGANPFVYMQYCFQTVFVDSVNQSGDGDVTRETVVFAYGSRPAEVHATDHGRLGRGPDPVRLEPGHEHGSPRELLTRL